MDQRTVGQGYYCQFQAWPGSKFTEIWDLRRAAVCWETRNSLLWGTLWIELGDVYSTLFVVAQPVLQSLDSQKLHGSGHQLVRPTRESWIQSRGCKTQSIYLANANSAAVRASESSDFGHSCLTDAAEVSSYLGQQASNSSASCCSKDSTSPRGLNLQYYSGVIPGHLSWRISWSLC